MLRKEDADKVFSFLFPYGNFRYYIMYFSSLLVLGISVYTISVLMGQIDYGMLVRTDTFVAYMPYPQSNFVTETVATTVTNLMNVFSWIWVVFFIHTCLSAVIDLVRVGLKIVNFIIKKSGDLSCIPIPPIK